MKFWKLKYGRGITQELFLWRRTLSFHTGIYLAGLDSMRKATGISIKAFTLAQRLGNTLGKAT